MLHPHTPPLSMKPYSTLREVATLPTKLLEQEANHRNSIAEASYDSLGDPVMDGDRPSTSPFLIILIVTNNLDSYDTLGPKHLESPERRASNSHRSLVLSPENEPIARSPLYNSAATTNDVSH